MARYTDHSVFVGNKFNLLTVNGIAPKEYGSNRTVYTCTCDCGKMNVLALPYQLMSGAKKSCGCIKFGDKPLTERNDLTGKVFNELTIIELSNEKRKGKEALKHWKCLCSCGNTVILPGSVVKKGLTKSCGHLKYLAYNKKEGKFRSKVYSAWKNAIFRCYDDSYVSSSRYKGRGITVAEEFLSSFDNFYNYIGDPPNERYTLDRVDVDKGYERGNIQWVLPEFQARNKKMLPTNKSGVTGVHLQDCVDNAHRWIASWKVLENGKRVQKSKSFSVNTYGYERAFDLAVEFRKAMIEELNKQGYGYSDKHGSEIKE